MAASGIALVLTVSFAVGSKSKTAAAAPNKSSSLEVTNLNANFMPPTQDAGSCPTTINGLVGKYSQIFPTGNRNAASYKWFSYIFACANSGGIDSTEFEKLGKGFCPISGSPIDGATTGKIELPKIGGGTITGKFHFCCAPCICDITDIVHVDTKTVQFKDQSKQYHVLVHGDPCKNPDKLNVPFMDPFAQQMETLAAAAPEVKCTTTGKLEGATFSDGGLPIIGLLYSTATPAGIDGTSPESKAECKKRAAAGFNSGMGMIFQKVAGATPL